MPNKYNDVILFTRKVNKQPFKFIQKTSISCITGKPYKYLIIDTPENCLGYTDTVLFSSSGQPYTLHRYQPTWVLNKLKQIAISNKLEHLIN